MTVKAEVLQNKNTSTRDNPAFQGMCVWKDRHMHLAVIEKAMYQVDWCSEDKPWYSKLWVFRNLIAY